MHGINPLWIPILGILMPLVLVPMIMVLKHRTLQREWQHKERMKAIEMGAPPLPANGGRQRRGHRSRRSHRVRDRRGRDQPLL